MFKTSDTKNSSRLKSVDIQPVFDYPMPSDKLDNHIRLIEKTILSIIPDHLLFKDQESIKSWMGKTLPFIKWSECNSSPDCLTIYFICKPIREIKTQNFFIDLLKRWLLTNKEIDIISQWSMLFHFPNDFETVYFVSEVNILVESGQDYQTMLLNLPLIAKELISGISSSKYAKYILENKNLLYDRKISLTNQDLIRLLEKRPNHFDISIFTEINRFLALTNESFRKERPYRHVTRLACSLYLLRKTLKRWLSSFPEKRHLYIRFVPTTLNFTFGNKPALGLVIGVNLFDQHEFFNEKHIVAGVKKFMPTVQSVKNTFYSYQEPKDSIRTIYFEIEKKDGKKFSLREIKELKDNLTNELKGHIEKLIPAIFLTRNEEEIMRNILILSQELKYVSDFPQIHITFEYQSVEHLTFTVVLVRICKPHTEPIEKLLRSFDTELNFSVERTQTIGFLRKRYPKEANVFRLKVKKIDDFFRKDSSVNLLVARKAVLSIVEGAFGQVRDFNGGMLLKQWESFANLKKLYSNIPASSQDLLESFFYSINPIEMQTRLDSSLLKKFSMLFLKQLSKDLKKRDSYLFDVIEEKKNLIVMIRASETRIREEIQKALGSKKFSIVSTQVNFQGAFSLGFIFPAKEDVEKKHYLKLVKKGISSALHEKHSQKILRLNCYSLLSLDPRVGGDEASGIVLNFLFEGLMRLDKNGCPKLGLAKSYKISEDKQTYTFTLKNSFWSDGSKVCAYDFEYAWKKILSPDFFTVFTFVFYPIKNARKAKDGQVSLDQIGIKASDNSTLTIKLEYPAPYFLELLALPLFSPINHKLDKINPNWASEVGGNYISNGPYTIEKASSDRYIFKKNTYFRDQKGIKFNEINIVKTNPHTAFEMLKNKELDSVLIPNNFYTGLKNKVNSQEFSAKTSGLKMSEVILFNTRQFPFNNRNIRKALCLSVSKAQLLTESNLSCDSQDSLFFEQYKNKHNSLKPAYNIKEAQKFFLKGLEELNLDIYSFPTIGFSYVPTETRRKAVLFLKKIWKDTFGIDCISEEYEWTVFFHKLTTGTFQIGLASWFSPIQDPIYNFNWFRYRDADINTTNWESSDYQNLLYEADYQSDPLLRKSILKKAEKIFMNEVPAFPLFHYKKMILSHKNTKNSSLNIFY